jgi:hypothetical protein
MMSDEGSTNTARSMTLRNSRTLPGQVCPLQQARGARVNARNLAAVNAVELGEEEGHQLWEIFWTLAQAWNPDLNAVQTGNTGRCESAFLRSPSRGRYW